MDGKSNEGVPQSLNPQEVKKPLIRDTHREHLRKTLRHYLTERKELPDPIPQEPDGTIKVLSVGSGFGYEAEPVVNIFPNAHYKGIDWPDARAGELTNDDLDQEKVQFVAEDARILEENERDKYGLVVIRHPQVSGTTADVEIDMMQALSDKKRYEPKMIHYWQSIFKASIDKLKEKGYMIVTTDSEAERYRISDFLQHNSVIPWIDEVNKASKMANRDAIHTDSYIIVGQKVSLKQE